MQVILLKHTITFLQTQSDCIVMSTEVNGGSSWNKSFLEYKFVSRYRQKQEGCLLEVPIGQITGGGRRLGLQSQLQPIGKIIKKIEWLYNNIEGRSAILMVF
jgi:hypothetical protein